MLAEDIYRIGQTRLGGGRDNLLTDGLDPAVGIVAILRRHRMGRQQSGLDPDRQRLSQSAGHPQHLEFVIQRQAIAGLDLHRGDPFADQGCHPRQRQLEQLLFAGGTGGTHRADDAAAPTGDLGIGHPLLAQLELFGTAAGEDQMGVTIDKAGSDQLAPHILPVSRIRPLQLGHRHQRVDLAILHADGVERQQAVVGQLIIQGSGRHVEPDPLAVQQFLVHSDLKCIYIFL